MGMIRKKIRTSVTYVWIVIFLIVWLFILKIKRIWTLFIVWTQYLLRFGFRSPRSNQNPWIFKSYYRQWGCNRRCLTSNGKIKVGFLGIYWEADSVDTESWVWNFKKQLKSSYSEPCNPCRRNSWSSGQMEPRRMYFFAWFPWKQWRILAKVEVESVEVERRWRGGETSRQEPFLLVSLTIPYLRWVFWVLSSLEWNLLLICEGITSCTGWSHPKASFLFMHSYCTFLELDGFVIYSISFHLSPMGGSEGGLEYKIKIERIHFKKEKNTR